MKVIDDCLPNEVFNNIYKSIMGLDMTWTFLPSVAYQSDADTHDNYMHYHLAYNDHKPVSKMYEVLQPVIERLEPQALLRIMINSYPYTPELKVHGSHKDYGFKHKGAILYLNTCDGYTYCEGQRVYSVANRVLLHDSWREHHSTATTDAKRRVICNINYL